MTGATHAVHPLGTIVNPASIAFFGASNRFTAMGTNQLSSLKDLGFSGAVYPVHPREKEVLGYRAFRSVADLPEVPDLAILVLPADAVVSVLEACAQKGIRHAIVVSGGFKEVGPRGVDLEERLKAVAGRYGVRFLGPNCLGVVNPHHRFNPTFMPFEGRPGFVGLVSQSGSYTTQMFRYLDERGLGFSTAISVGNEADIDLVDGLAYLAECPHTKVIGLYIETIRRGRRFIETARSICPRKPIVAFYVGGSEAGRQASFSHTGAMAGSDRLYDGVFRQSGIVRARSMVELFDFCAVLAMCPPVPGRRVAIQTHSGGPGASAADACGREGLTLSGFSDQTLRNMRAFVPRTGSLSNPVDLTFSKNIMEFFDHIPDLLLADPNVDGLLIYLLLSQRTMKPVLSQMGVAPEDIEQQAEQITAHVAQALSVLPQRHAKPLIGFSYRSDTHSLLKPLRDAGIPVLPSPESAARAMAALVAYRELTDKLARSAAFTHSGRGSG